VTGKKVLLSPEWINNLSWTDSTVCVDLTRGAIKMRPNTTGRAPLIVIVKPVFMSTTAGKAIGWIEQLELVNENILRVLRIPKHAPEVRAAGDPE
jgi:hypothetical protein